MNSQTTTPADPNADPQTPAAAPEQNSGETATPAPAPAAETAAAPKTRVGRPAVNKSKAAKEPQGRKRSKEEVARGVEVAALSRQWRKNPKPLLALAQRALDASQGDGTRMVEALQKEVRTQHKLDVTVTAARGFLEVLRDAGLLKRRKAGNKYRWSRGSGETPARAAAPAVKGTQRGGGGGGGARKAGSELDIMAQAHALIATLPVDARSRVLAWLGGTLLGGAPAHLPVAAAARPADVTPGRVTAAFAALAELARRVKPSTDAERILLAAYHLTTAEKQQNFRTRDLSSACKGAGFKAFSNAAVAVKNGVAKGWLAKRGKNVSLTAAGRKQVEGARGR